MKNVDSIFAVGLLAAALLSLTACAEPVAPSVETVANGTYPLDRYLHVAVDGRAGGRAAEATRDFVAFNRSSECQEMLAKEGLLRRLRRNGESRT
jgi:ABC-type phosphate transport system substrate-binding protein